MTPVSPPSIDPPKLCPICEKLLDSTDYRFHDSCILCVYCGSPVHKDIVSKLVESEIKEVYHQPCRDARLREEMKQKPVIITQEKLNMLNRCLFPFQPDMRLTKETNQQLSDNALRSWLTDIGNTPEDENGIKGFDRLYYIVSNLEAVAASIHIIVGKNKDYIIDRDTKRLAEKFKEKDEIIKDAEKRQKAQKESNQRQFERLDSAARARRNAIEGYMKIFTCSEEVATAMVEKAKEGAK